MDPILMQKIQAIKKSKKHQLLDNFLMFSLTALTCSLFCSSPFWLPYLCSSTKVFLFTSVPRISSVLFNPKLLFIVANLIVIVLIGESKVFASGSSLSSDVYYEEYINRSRRFECKKEQNMEKPCKEIVKKSSKDIGEKVVPVGRIEPKIEVTKNRDEFSHGEDKMGKPCKEIVKKSSKDIGEKVVPVGRIDLKIEVTKKRDDFSHGEDDEFSFPIDELNKRADDFIARVNRQRRLEARLLLSGSE